MTADLRLSAALRALAAALHDLPAPAMIIGGVAVIAAGVPRQTIDIDATVLGSGVDLDTAIDTFEAEALSRAREIDVDGVSLRVARPEDLIVYKAAAWRDRDRSDIERLLVLHIDDIDLARVRGLVSEIASVLGDPDRVREFDRMVTRAIRERR